VSKGGAASSAGGRRKILVPAGVASLEALRDVFPITEADLGEGRVFVGRTRATTLATPLAEGAIVVVEAPSGTPVSLPAVLHEDAHLLVLEKPADWVTIAERKGQGRALLAWAAEGRKPVDLHATSRLDLGVSGVVTVAKGEAARDALARVREEGRYGRAYVAIAEGALDAREGVWNATIGRAVDPRHRAAGGRDATEARSRFVCIAEAPSGRASLLVLFPETGRTHQLRVHAAHAGHPLLGDRVYGHGKPVVTANGAVLALERIALHCHRVTLGAPFAQAFVSAIPDTLAALWEGLGGATRDLEAARDAATNTLPEPPIAERRGLPSSGERTQRGPRADRARDPRGARAPRSGPRRGR
jgi:23S rRNA pseudouridine1911/1915/1917 synthase